MTRILRFSLIALPILSVVAITVVLWCYIANFGPHRSMDQEIWAKFGDFVGGSLNPLLSFFALVALSLTLWVQILSVQVSQKGLEDARQEIQRQQRRSDEIDRKKRSVVFTLLMDEITKRWKGKIRRDLEEVSKQSDFIKVVTDLAENVETKEDDLIIFKKIGTSFSDFFFIENADLMSTIVYGHVLMCDFLDLRKAMKKHLPTTDVQLTKDLFKDLFETLLKEMDATFDKVLQMVEAYLRADDAAANEHK